MPRCFQRIGSGRPTVIVDYAYTPDGLANVLSTARKMPVSRIIVVFGCGGDRDRREAAANGQNRRELADFSIITSDNPRSEDPLQICAEVEAGIKPTGSEYIVEPDRKTAICRAIRHGRGRRSGFNCRQRPRNISDLSRQDAFTLTMGKWPSSALRREGIDLSYDLQTAGAELVAGPEAAVFSKIVIDSPTSSRGSPLCCPARGADRWPQIS